MNNFFLIAVVLLIPKFCISQLSPNDKIIFLDSTFNETKSETHFYYRIIKESKSDKESYAIQNFYKSGTLLMGGRTSSKNDNVKKAG